MPSLEVQGAFDPHYIASVLADLLSDQYGVDIDVVLTPKEEPEAEAARQG